MICTIVGYENIQYVNKDNRQVKGLRLYYQYEDDSITGKACDTVYVSADSPAYIEKPELNRKYDFNYQHSGFTGKTRLVSIKAI